MGKQMLHDGYPGLCTPRLGAPADGCRRLPTAADDCRRLPPPTDSFFFGVGCEALGGAARWPAPRAATRRCATPEARA
eukprot:365325-Chlamydomonas_euryale.AAC.45